MSPKTFKPCSSAKPALSQFCTRVSNTISKTFWDYFFTTRIAGMPTLTICDSNHKLQITSDLRQCEPAAQIARFENAIWAVWDSDLLEVLVIWAPRFQITSDLQLWFGAQVSHKRVFTLICWQPRRANTDFCCAFFAISSRDFRASMARTPFLCDTLALPLGAVTPAEFFLVEYFNDMQSLRKVCCTAWSIRSFCHRDFVQEIPAFWVARSRPNWLNLCQSRLKLD